MGTVYRAYQHTLSREVAIKVLSPQLNDDPNYLRRFNDEAKTAAALTHPNIVTIFDFGTQGDISYVVMRYLTGGSLSERIRVAKDQLRGRISLGEVSTLLNQIVSALDYAHHEGVVHRDIKPQNIMFDGKGNPYIVDFGIAKLLHQMSMTMSGIAMGSPSYMPPEQWRGAGISGLSDQYALAVMIYELVTNRLPFEGDSQQQLMYKHLSETPPAISVSRPELPPALTTVLNRALAKEPADRFPNCTQFAQAFAQAIEGIAGVPTEFFTFPLPKKSRTATPVGIVTATPASQPGLAGVPAPHQTQPDSRRSGMIIGAAGALGVLVVVGILALVLFSNRGGLSPSDLTLIALAETLTAVDLTTEDVETLAPTETPVPSETESETATPRAVVILASDTPEPSETPEPTATETATLTRTATASPTATDTSTATHTATNTATSTATSTATPSPTNTPSPTETPSPTATSTPEPTATVDTRALAIATRDRQRTEVAATDAFATAIVGEFTALAAIEQTETASAATETPSHTPTDTATLTATATPTLTSTPTSSPTASSTYTVTPSPTSTRTPTATATATASRTPTVTATASSTPTTTPSATETADATLTLIAEATRSAVPARVRVIQTTANLRVGPGTDYRVAESASRDDVFDVRAQYTRHSFVWYLIELRDDEENEWVAESAWIRSDLVEILEEFEGAVIPTASAISPTPRPVTAVPTQPAAVTSVPGVTQPPGDNPPQPTTPPQPTDPPSLPPTPRPPG